MNSRRDQGYVYFLSEAPELLQAVEDGLLKLHEGNRIQNVHGMMRATHTLKGAAANVGLEGLKSISHSMEDAFKALYNEEIPIDNELEGLLFEGYECLRNALTAEMNQTPIDEEVLLNRAADVLARLRDKLGDDFGQKEYIPTSSELGFDIAKSIFELGVQQRLDELKRQVEQGDIQAIEDSLRSGAEVFVGLGESLNLPGWSQIAETVLQALGRSPKQIQTIGELALADYQQGQRQVLGGDRDSGGSPSAGLLALAQGTVPEAKVARGVVPSSPGPLDSLTTEEVRQDETALDVELGQFREFLGDKRYGKPVSSGVAEFFEEAIRTVAAWFAQEEEIPLANFCFELMVPKLPRKKANHKKTVVKTASGIKKWVEAFLTSIEQPKDSASFKLYRHWTMLSMVVMLAKFQYASDTQQPKTYEDVMLVEALRRLNRAVGDRYQELPPVSKQEKNWLQHPAVEQLRRAALEQESEEDEDLLEGVWGDLDDAPAAMSDDLISQGDESTLEAVVESNIPEPEIGAETGAKTGAEIAEGKSQTDPPQETSEAPLTTPASESTASDVVEDPVQEGEFFDETPSASKAKTQGTSRTAAGEGTTRQLVSVDIKGLERLNHRLGELLVDRNRQALEEEALQQSAVRLRSQIHQHRDTISQLLDWSERTLMVSGDAARVMGQDPFSGNPLSTPIAGDGFNFDSIADLHLLLKTAFGQVSGLEQNTEDIYGRSRELAQLMEKQQQLLSVMQDDLVDVRMLPFGEVLQRFPLMLQQLSRIQGKPVTLEMDGQDLLIEQSIAQKLYEPLLHLVRNAFDHGIESSDDRLAAGKPEVGTISIRAYNQGVQTTIEVRDDGRGLNLEGIRRKAVEGKFLSEEEARQIISTNHLDVLFEPGFSTAGQVNEISGRGVGLDVVRSQLQTLKGRIAVESQPGQGTVFILQIPLSITIAKVLVVQAGGSAYGLLLDSIDKIVMPPPGHLKHFENHRVLQLDTEDDNRTMVSVRQLADLLHYQSSLVEEKQEPTTNKLSISRDLSAPILLLRQASRLMGLEVDRIIGEQELVIRPLGQAIAPPPYVYGCSILSDSRLALVIDGGEIFQSQTGPTLPQTSVSHPQFSRSSQGRSAVALGPSDNPSSSASLDDRVSPLSLSPAVTDSRSQSIVLLVIDDSINLRHTLTATLRDAGYEVVQARDGQEAISQLQEHPEIALALCDIEMPHMNGFEFLTYCRQGGPLAQLPIVMLTSHSSQKYRQIAKELGCTGYLTKPLSQPELLSILEELLGEEGRGQ
ncbi:hybrid sensor histidine kinase/response regulator [Sodalinema gerasimenkoae]|uniref:hybrid sensor histidine kinase/response regulator n=1 Tax=Sodalinema gerasimenkoae TaxID=2862348 RepID=UPI00135896D1|nr:hybrid sensor histidine kinase/response regulator [Sodalinema gerasimenkoae]